MDGPCKGQIHDVEDGTPSVKARDVAGNRHVYLRTNAVDVNGETRVVTFRLARGSANGRRAHG